MTTQLFLLAGVALLAAAMQDDDPPPALAPLAGVSLGMAALARYDTIIFLVPLAVVLIWGKGPAGKSRPVLVALGIAGVLYAQSSLHQRAFSPNYQPFGALVGLFAASSALLVTTAKILRRTPVGRRPAFPHGVPDFSHDAFPVPAQVALMANGPGNSSRRFLEPIDRVSEVLFGLIMVLTITGSLSVAEAGREDIRTMLVGALGCNLAWGIIDAVFYLMGCLAGKARDLATYRAVREDADPQRAQRLIADALPPVVASVLQPVEFEAIRERLKGLPDPPARAHLAKDDWLGALGVFLLVFSSTFPVVIPFLFMHSAVPALRVSSAIAIALLFLAGYSYGRITGRRPVRAGIAMVVLGSILVSLTMALGG